MQIRRATVDDASALVPLLEQLGYPSTASEVQERLTVILQHPDYNTWVVQQGKRIIGLTGARIGYAYEQNGCYGQLTALVVDAEFRGGGVGTALVQTAEAWIRERGGIAIVVNSGSHREEAHQFYEHLGYAATGLRWVKELR